MTFKKKRITIVKFRVVHFVRAKNDEVGYRATNAQLTVQSVAGFSDSCARKTYSETNN